MTLHVGSVQGNDCPFQDSGVRRGDITQHISHDMGLHDVFCGCRPMTLRIDFAQGRMMVLDKHHHCEMDSLRARHWTKLMCAKP